MFNFKWGYLIKRPYISLIIALNGSECENYLLEVKPWESFVEFDL